MSAVATVDVLNLVKPNRYFVAWRENGRVEYNVVESGEILMVLPGMSVRVVDVRAKPLDGVQPPRGVVEHPRVRWLSDLVGSPPALKTYQYVFTPLKLRLVQRLETGVEYYMPTQEQDAPPIVVYTVNAYYIVYKSNSGRLYSEVKGGARAYQLVAQGQLKPPQIYLMKLDKHRYEVGVRVPIDEGRVRQLISYLTGP